MMWIIDFLRKLKQRKEEEWEPEPLYIEDEELPLREEEVPDDEEKRVIIIEL
jgi:hypothetical protein